MQAKFRFNKKTLDELPLTGSRTRYRDTGVEGLVLDVTKTGYKSFRVYKRMRGANAPVSVTLGKYPEMSIENARKAALTALEKIGAGISPSEERKATKAAQITLEEVYRDYVATKRLSASTLKGYETIMRTYLGHFAKKPLNQIDEAQVKAAHSRVSESSPAQADLVMRFLRAIFNFAKYEYRGLNNRIVFDHNPVTILSHQKLWNNVPRRQTRLTKKQLKEWFDGLETVRQQGGDFAGSVCDLAEMALLTGLRRSELLSLHWSNVNLEEKTYFISTTKNGDPLELPISNHLHKLLKKRSKLRDERGYVFNADNEYGMIREPRKVLAEIEEKSNVTYTLHDLRRTYTTAAEALNVGTYTLKRLLNHRTRRDDVTEGYTVLTPEELREPAQQIENSILAQAGILDQGAELNPTLEALLASLSESEKTQLVAALSEKKTGVENV